jgi:hypothetical protein
MLGTTRPRDVEPYEASLPDMVEEVRIVAEVGRGPSLVISRRKMSRSQMARLRYLVNEPADDV